MAKVLFYSNSLQRELEVEAINLKANTFVVRVDKRLMTLDGADKLFDRIRAEARAEALGGAEKRGRAWFIGEYGEMTQDGIALAILAAEPKEECGAEVASLIDLRNIIGGVGATDDNDSDNLAIALACYFSDRLDRPDDDEIDEETGWSKWALKKSYSLMDRVVLAIIDRKPAEVERRIEEWR